MSVKTVLILGATGTIGRPLLDELAGTGVQVRAAVRDTSRPSAEGLQWVRFDYFDSRTYDRALEGVDAVFLLTPVMQDPQDVTARVVMAAKRHGVRRVVKLSAMGADTVSGARLLDWHRLAEEAIQDCGVRWTFLRPNGYFQNYLGLQAETIRSKGAFYLPLADAKVSYVDARNVAEVAAVALLRSDYEGKVLNLTGPEALSNQDIASILSKKVGSSIRYIPEGDGQAEQRMKALKMPEWQVQGILELYRFWRSGHAMSVDNGVHRVTGHLATSFETFSGDFASEFSDRSRSVA